MYSYEDRVRAVKLYIKLGKRIAATIRELGYPTKNALKNWHLEFERCRDLPMRYLRFCRNSVIRPSLAARQTLIRKPASRAGSLQTKLGL